MVVGGTLAVVTGARSTFVGSAPRPAEIVARSQSVVRAVEALALRDRISRRLRSGKARMTISIGGERDPHNRDRKES